MALRIIATCTNDDLGLVEENEVIGANQKTMEVLVDLRYAKVYDDTKPIVGKSVNVYEEKVYPIGRQVFNNDSVYISNKETSATWIHSLVPNQPNEWDVLVTGANAV